MENFILSCKLCNNSTDFKWKSKFDRVNKKNFVCPSCKRKIILENKTRTCPKCHDKIVHQSPSAKIKAEKKQAICKKCRSNQIPNEFSLFQKEILNGLLLGDGSIPNNNRLYPRLSVTRQLKDKEYLYWQFNNLKDFYGTEPKYFRSYHARAQKYYEGYSCRTKSGKVFKEYRDKWYNKSGKKIVPRDLSITPYTLLVWFLDDGCIIKKSDNNLSVKFSTDSFKKSDVIFLQKLLNKTYDTQLKVYKNGNGFILKGSTNSVRKLIAVIDPIFLKCMFRKKTW